MADPDGADPWPGTLAALLTDDPSPAAAPLDAALAPAADAPLREALERTDALLARAVGGRGAAAPLVGFLRVQQLLLRRQLRLWDLQRVMARTAGHDESAFALGCDALEALQSTALAHHHALMTLAAQSRAVQCLALDTADSEGTFGLGRAVFAAVLDALAAAPPDEDPPSAAPLRQRVCAVLAQLTTNESARDAGRRFGVARASVMPAPVCDAIAKALHLRRGLPPCGSDDRADLYAQFHQKYGLPSKIAGAVSVHMIPVRRPLNRPYWYADGLGSYAVKLLAVTDPRGRIIDYSLCPGATDPQLVVEDSDLHRFEQFLFEDGSCVVVSDAVPPDTFSWAAGAAHLAAGDSPPEHTDPIRAAVADAEAAVLALKARFRCLALGLDLPLHAVPSVVAACIALHNELQARGFAVRPPGDPGDLGAQQIVG